MFRSNRRHRRSSPAVAEQLESRRLMSTSPIAYMMPGGVLTIAGTSGPESITVALKDGRIAVSQRIPRETGGWNIRAMLYVPVGNVTQIKAVLMNGDDHLSISEQITIQARIWGGPGDDILVGGSGNDVIYGSWGNDNIQGRGGNDWLFGELHNDHVYGGPGNDMLNGGGGQDYLYGGDGNDLFEARDGIPDLVRGGAGNDRAKLDDTGKGTFEKVSASVLEIETFIE